MQENTELGPKSKPERWVKLYLLEEGDLNKEDPLLLSFVDKYATAGQASKFLHSQECFQKYIRDRGVTEAQFVIISDAHHYAIKPMTLYVTISQNNLGQESDKKQGKVVG